MSSQHPCCHLLHLVFFEILTVVVIVEYKSLEPMSECLECVRVEGLLTLGALEDWW